MRFMPKVLFSLFSLILTPSLASAQIAQDADPAKVGGAFMNMFPLILVVIVFYFLIIRPQGKKVKEHKQMVESLKRGDKVITGGGIEAVVVRVDETNKMLELEIAPGVKVKAVRDTVTQVVTRDQPKEKAANDEAQPEKKKK